MADLSRPFVKSFHTAAHHYLYDVSSDALFQTDEATAAVGERWRRGLRGEDLVALRGRFSPRVLGRAIREVRRWRRRGYLSARRPEGLRFPLSSRVLRGQLRHHIQQLILSVTDSCNLRCRYCVYGGSYSLFRPHRAGHMSAATARAALEFFFEHSDREQKSFISFYGGEPLGNFPLIQECIEQSTTLAPGRELFFNLNTNGTLLRDRVQDFLAKHRIALRVSLDGPLDVHDANRTGRAGRGSFDLVMSNLRRLRARHPDYYRRYVSICAVIASPHAIARVRRFFEHEDLFEGLTISVNGLRKDGADFLRRRPEPPVRLAHADRLRRDYVRQVSGGGPVSPFLKALFERPLLTIARRAIGRPLARWECPNMVCPPGVRRLFVDARGRFQPCERFNDTVFIGDVQRGFDLVAIQQVIDRYVEISERDCCQCWALRLCGTCFVSANGNGIAPDCKRRHCESERAGVLEALKLYCTLMEKNPHCLDHLTVLEME